MHPSRVLACLLSALCAAATAQSEGPCEAMPFAIEGQVLDAEGAEANALPHAFWPIARMQRGPYATPELARSHYRMQFDASIGGASCEYPESVKVLALGRPGQYSGERVSIRGPLTQTDLVLPSEPSAEQWQELALKFKADTTGCGGTTLFPETLIELQQTRVLLSERRPGITLQLWTEHRDVCQIPPESARARRFGGAVWLSYELACRKYRPGEAASYCLDTPRLRFHLPELESVPDAVWLMEEPRPVQAPIVWLD